MVYYNGDIRKLLINFYNFLHALGYDVTISGENDEIVVICNEFSGVDEYGTGSWRYEINKMTYCDDIKEFIPSVKCIRKQNNNGRDIVSSIYQYDGSKIFWKRHKFKESEWLECSLGCMISGRSFNEILSKFNITFDCDIDEDISYTIVARDIKLKMLLND